MFSNEFFANEKILDSKGALIMQGGNIFGVNCDMQMTGSTVYEASCWPRHSGASIKCGLKDVSPLSRDALVRKCVISSRLSALCH